MPIRIAGAGCCLMDSLYPGVDFSSPAFRAVLSRREGDGGLSPGRLVFSEDAERFAGKPFEETLRSILGAEQAPPTQNVGGPSVVALVHAAQMLEGSGISVAYHGAAGDDELGRELRRRLSLTSLDASALEARPGRTPSTFVLSDPVWDGGRGERCFVNDLGVALDYRPSELGEGFFGADIVALGGTALVPRLHEGLPGILARSRAGGALTVVNTVFDFRAERRDWVGAWPLGGDPAARGPGPVEAYRTCDLLVMDLDEALRLSGDTELPRALDFFAASGVGAFVVTRGASSVLAWAGEGRFGPLARFELPVGDGARDRGGRGDTTGCGDAFAGGLLAALAQQLAAGEASLDLVDAISWGIAAGGFTLGILGGTYYEARPGEKRESVSALRDAWLGQVGEA